MLAVLTFASDAECLTPEQILDRLRAEFRAVEVDPQAGRARCMNELAILRRLNAPREIIDMTERGVAHALWVTVRDGDLSFEFMLTPEANIRIDHEEQHEPLIRRCAATLGCLVEECG
jgi:hypothetical protein